MTVNPKTGDVVVARDDAIYYYTLDGRGPPRAYESPKSRIAVYQDYVGIVSRPQNSAVRDPSSIQRQFSSQAADDIFNTSQFSLLETDLKLIAHSEAVVSGVKAIFQMGGDLFTLTEDGKVSRGC